jgi:hypothetical protein
MQTLSAIDAISPAWQHTSRLLYAPRSWRLLLKIGAVAVFAQMGGCNFNAPMNFGNGLGNAHPASAHLPSAALLATIVFVGFAVAFVIGLGFLYLGSRLQFVLFDIVLRRDTVVGPIWRRYGRATWHWIGLKLTFFVLAFVCFLPITIPILLQFVHVMKQMPSGGDVPPDRLFAFFGVLFGFLGLIFLGLLLFGIGYVLLQDFGLPSMALESTPMRETVARVVRLVRAEPLQVFLYLLMRFVLAFAAAIAGEIALFLSILITLIPLGGAALVLWFSLRHAGSAGWVAMICGWVVLGLIFAALVIVAAIMYFGYLMTFLQAYALYFLGGRYPLLGEMLWPSPLPPPFVAPPPLPPDPALA